MVIYIHIYLYFLFFFSITAELLAKVAAAQQQLSPSLKIVMVKSQLQEKT